MLLLNADIFHPDVADATPDYTPGLSRPNDIFKLNVIPQTEIIHTVMLTLQKSTTREKNQQNSIARLHNQDESPFS